MGIEYKETFVFYESYGKTFERLRQIDKDKADQYISALIRYGLYGELPNEDSDVWLFGFDGVIATINSAKTNRAKKINIPKEELQELIEQGKTQEEMAKSFSCSVDTIQRRMKEYGLTVYRKTANTPQQTAHRTDNRKETASSYNVNVKEKGHCDGKSATTAQLCF